MTGLLAALALLVSGSQPVQAARAPKLELKVVTTDDAGFFANSILLIGEHEVMLVDAQLTRSGAIKVIDEIRKSGKELTLIYVTHAHADHFLGLDAFEAAYPGVKVIAVPEVVRGIEAVYREKLDKWKGLLGDAASSRTVAVMKYDRDAIMFDGVPIRILRHLRADTPDSTMLWLPSQKTMISGDVTFVDMHVYAPETDRPDRRRWRGVLARIRDLKPELVIPGHNKIGARLDANTAVDFTETYLDTFERTLSESTNATAFSTKMQRLFPTAELKFSLERGATASFPTK